MIKRTKYFLLIVFLFGSLMSFAQYENTSGNKQQDKKQVKSQPLKKPRMKRWFAGGMLGAGFSSWYSYVEVSPLLGYKVTRDFHVGTRLTYIYSGEKYCDNCPRYNAHSYGGSLFARYIFLKFLMAHVEYEMLSNNYFDIQGNEYRQTYNSLFLGGGYYQNFAGRGFASFLILFNVLDSENSPYVNPIFRIGFGVGF